MANSIAPWINDPTQMSPSLNLGLSLLANSNTPGGFGSIFGRSALQAGQNSQQAQLVQQQIEQARINQQIAQQKMAFLGAPGGMGGLAGGPQQPPQASQGAPPDQQAPPGASPPWMPQVAPQAPPQQSAEQPNPWLSPPTKQDIDSTPIGGMSPDWLARYSVAIDNQNPLAAYQSVHKQQLELAQQQIAPKLASIDYLLKSDTPSKYMQADKQLVSAWPQLAAQAGLDPQKDFTDDGVRHALNYARNQLASSVGLPEAAQTNKLITKELPDGRIAQIDPITGKQTIESASGLEKVIDPKTGQPILVPTAKAAGMTPFNQSIFGAANMDDQTKEMAYQFAKVNGGKLPPFMSSRGDAAKGALANYIAKRAAEEGDTATSMVAQGQATQAAGNVLKDFTSGATNKKIVAINTGVAHLDALNPLIDAMGSGNLTAINKARQFFEKQTGKPAPTNYSTLAEMAVGEVSQAVMAGGGTGPEREALAAPFKSGNGPDVLRGAVKTAVTALAGKTDALRTSWDSGTNGTQGKFERFLGPETKKALGISPDSVPKNAKGWELHVDAKGNKAYVSPDGKSFEEVK